ncbi:conserved hypothetical protein [Candidatus Caldarchaeum subterraneum]|uniref:GTP-dependent dephospho-CoA kinase n=1 Tax=Caldiarchaeum subterraneum TaxID=311458 RepID=E6N589_CALS0|nr:conserved hypothetical protein [Candidatus Caldarchaeum subterraneum]BAJ49282.1 conserved hypothetical protein [Candidatus Caldarchaeum subterraneum]BAJ50297.1 conserved hypothetical protein [Candidatus Caldarchaeum subterraneum]GBC72463.1 hypothetical protein HRbin03_00292 [archaeon HR03]
MTNIWSRPIVFTEDMKNRVRKPLGELRHGDLNYSPELAQAKPLVVVGDYTFRRMIEAGLRPDVVVVDAKVMRNAAEMPRLEGYEVTRVRNMAGVIEPEAAEAVMSAVKKGRGAVFVDGEEDLLALPAIHALPDGGVVVYGQPRQGYVVVKASVKVKKLVEEIISMATV